MTKEKMVSNQASNTWMDKVMQGCAVFTLGALAYHEVLRHVRATQPISFGLAGLVIGFLVYLVFAPLFRSK